MESKLLLTGSAQLACGALLLLGCGAPDRHAPGATGASAASDAAAPALAPTVSGSGSEPDDTTTSPPLNDEEGLASFGQKSARVLPWNEKATPSRGCDPLRIPAREYLMDDAWTTSPPGWEVPLPDMNGDARPEVGTTSAAHYNSALGNVLVAVYLPITKDCFRFVGHIFGGIVQMPSHRHPAWRPSVPHAFLVESRTSRLLMSREAELSVVNDKLVIHRHRYRIDSVEEASRCSRWQSWGKPFSHDFWDIQLGDDLPAFRERC